MSSLTHTNTDGKTTTYSFVYSAADLQTAVNIGSRNLVSNAYNSGTWTLSSQTYGNGDYWKYFYDNMDTLTSRFTNCSDNEGIGFYYTYNGKGKLVRIEMKSVTIADGAVTGGTLLSSENYLYDGSDRLIRVVETDGDNVVKHDFSWTYDAKDNVTALTESIGGKSFSYTYAYDDDSRPTSFGYGDVTKQVTYDGHGRSSGTTVKNGSRTVLGTGYAYRDVDSTYTTTQVKSVTNSYGGKTANFNYTYDASGNITSISGAQAVTYEYDDLGQLVWEKNATAGKAWNYTYDNGGNILSRTEYACSSSGTVSGSGTTTSYTYGDAEWGDLLTAYNGEAISYDGIGNPLSYRGWTMSWQGGRQLSSMTKGSDTLSFAYNESGLRTSKTVNGVTHSYVWQGSKLAADITDAYALYFHYDSSGEVIGFTRTANGTDIEYFYVKNLQGDILKVITATGTEAATYTYDAWGKLLTSSGDMAEANPIRYRGYYYDTETGLYYLQSRYYDPEISRFINPDAFASTGRGILGTNMFVYCNNEAVSLYDALGCLPATSTMRTDSGKRSLADCIIYYMNIHSKANMDEIAFNNTYSTNYSAVPIATYDDLVDALDSLPIQTRNVYIYIHGTADELCLYHETYNSSDILSTIPVVNIEGSIYLFSCRGGLKIAPALAEATQTNVYACMQKVSFSSDGRARCGVRSLIHDFLKTDTGWFIFASDGTQMRYSYLYCD